MFAQRSFDEFVQLFDFNIGNAAPRVIYDRKPQRERSDEWRPVADAGSDGFAKIRQFLRELPSLKSTDVDPVWNENAHRPAVSASSGCSDDRERLLSRFDIQAGRRAGHQNQVGEGDGCAQSAIVRRRVDDDQFGRDALNVPNPIGDALTFKRNFVNREAKMARFGPSPGRTLCIAVDKGDVETAAARFAGETYRKCGFADAAFALRDGDSSCQSRFVATSNRRASDVKVAAQWKDGATTECRQDSRRARNVNKAKFDASASRENADR